MAEVIKSPNSIDKPIWKRGLMNIVYSEDNPELMPLQIGLKTKELLSHFSNRDKAKLFLISLPSYTGRDVKSIHSPVYDQFRKFLLEDPVVIAMGLPKEKRWNVENERECHVCVMSPNSGGIGINYKVVAFQEDALNVIWYNPKNRMLMENKFSLNKA